MKIILIIFLIITLLNFINKSESACSLPTTGANCTSTLLYVPLTVPNDTVPILNFNITSSLSKTNNFIGTIKIDSIKEFDQNKKLVNSIPFTNWLSISDNSKFKYSIKSGDLSLLIDINWSTNQINSTLNYTSIEFSFNITKYQFQSPTNTLTLVLVQSLSDNQIASGKTACGISQLTQNSVFHQEVKLGDTVLLGELNPNSAIDGNIENQFLSASQINASTTVTTSSIQTSQIISINIPNFQSFAQFSTNYFPIKAPAPITSTFATGTVCVSVAAANTGRTSQQVAAICVGVIGFSIIGIMALHFFYLNGRFYNKKD
ncbi:hypothetical protein RB653_009307 [Dictyostelium firmibasis]|uniref:Uncharacterized protein n=1 Tax=Dictyostelium firmibasis TaxID=79012 RepID=A0AAN7YXA3_9MYCE